MTDEIEQLKAALHGKMTGKCCFCNSPLIDQKSTDVGYGPVCAKHYGLPHGKMDKAGLPGFFAEVQAVADQGIIALEELTPEAKPSVSKNAVIQGLASDTATVLVHQETVNGVMVTFDIETGKLPFLKLEPLPENPDPNGIMEDLDNLVMETVGVTVEQIADLHGGLQIEEEVIEFEKGQQVEKAARRKIEFEKTPGQAVKNLMEALHGQAPA